MALASIVALTSWLAPRPSEAAFYYVGAGCAHTTIATALDAAAATPASDWIVLTRTQSYTNVQLTLTNWNPATTGALTIAGGVDACGSPSVSGRTVLAGSGSNPVITVGTTGGGVSDVTLANLELHGGSRGLSVSGNSQVEVIESVLRNNVTGIIVTAGAHVELDDFTVVQNNIAGTHGGGIYCADPDTEVTLHGVVINNQASSGGGGIFATDFCSVVIGDGAVIQQNSAPLGGGVFLWGGTLQGSGGGELGARIIANTASDAGGGLYIDGPDSYAVVYNMSIDDNSAVNFGGGAAIVNGGELQLARSFSAACLAPPRCVTMSGNTLSSGFLGSAAYVAGGSTLFLGRAFVEGNSGPDQEGMLFYAEGSGTLAKFDGTQLWDNRTVFLFEAASSAAVEATYVTAAGNHFLVDGVPPSWDSRGAHATGGATVALFSSILVDQGPFSTASGGTVTGDCLLIDTAAGLTSSTGVPLVGVDPRFRNPATGDLRLQLDSPAIDSCDDEFATAYTPDYDLDARGHDLPWKSDVIGPYDRGADEVRPLFADGFETGNTSAWL